MKLSDLELVQNLVCQLRRFNNELSELENRRLITVHFMTEKQEQKLKKIFERNCLNAIANIEKQLKDLGVEVDE